MSYRTHYSNEEIQFLQTLFDSGHQGVSDSLEEMLGTRPESFSAKVAVIPASQLTRVMDVGIEPLGSVSSRFSGGVQGEFLYLQSKTDLDVLDKILSASSEPVPDDDDDADGIMVPEWLQEQRQARKLSQESSRDMLTTISELGNTLFGVYGSALLERTKLGIFQEISDATMDEHQVVFSKAISHGIKSSNLAVLFTFDFSIRSSKAKFWLVIFPNPEGLNALFECMEN
jgi:chemotaxis protein CheY-P-specific phosphatase CheC